MHLHAVESPTVVESLHHVAVCYVIVLNTLDAELDPFVGIVMRSVHLNTYIVAVE